MSPREVSIPTRRDSDRVHAEGVNSIDWATPIDRCHVTEGDRTGSASDRLHAEGVKFNSTLQGRSIMFSYPRVPPPATELVPVGTAVCLLPSLHGSPPSAFCLLLSAPSIYPGLITITESVWPFSSASVAGLVGSSSPTPSTRNL